MSLWAQTPPNSCEAGVPLFDPSLSMVQGSQWPVSEGTSSHTQTSFTLRLDRCSPYSITYSVKYLPETRSTELYMVDLDQHICLWSLTVDSSWSLFLTLDLLSDLCLWSLSQSFSKSKALSISINKEHVYMIFLYSLIFWIIEEAFFPTY